jgi:hypothetical protein
LVLNPNGLDFAVSGKIPYAGDFVTSVFLPGSVAGRPEGRYWETEIAMIQKFVVGWQR